ncbi:MAG: hypothetical protein KF764_19435 [Labilithrix sp.]|nr:hypothetical protein [Labilithrix sp.]
MSRFASVVVLALVAGATAHCGNAGEPHGKCPPSGSAAFLSFHQDAGVPLVGVAGDVLDEHAHGALVLNFGVDDEPGMGIFSVSFDTNSAPPTYEVSFQLGAAMPLLASTTGDRFPISAPAYVVTGNPCTVRPEPHLAFDITVLAARGAVDTHARTIDRNYRRVFAVDVDWNDIGCGIGNIRGRLTFTVTAAETGMYNCYDTYRLVGDDSPDASLLDASAFDASSDAPSADADPDARD